mgnify:CR=1 FL=1
MTLKTYLMIPVTVAALIAVPALAQNVDPEIDVNGDGLYSYPELQAGMPDMTEDVFGALDSNGDGLLDADEIAVGVEAAVLPPMDG